MTQILDFDQREGFIWFNNSIVPWKDAKIHLMSHGLHYGTSVFEGERAYEGKIFKLQEHTERLFDSARLLGFEIPYSVDQIIQATKDIVKIQNISDGYIRPIAWGGSDILRIGLPKKINVAIVAWQWPADRNNKEQLLKLCFSDWIRPDPRSAPFQSKAGGLYIICNMSKENAKNLGYDDALMLDYRGYIAEATASNFFMVKNNILYTPIADCFLNGITRLTVIEIAKSLNIEVIEKHILPDELADADEAFLTGTAAEITPIGSIDQYHYHKGPITEKIIDKYQLLVKE